jgi:hypothetical protein
MNCREDDSPSYISAYRNGPYSSSLASSASSSTASVWSDASSQTSDDSSVTGASDSSETLEPSETYCCPTQQPPHSFTSICEPTIPVAIQWSKRKSNVQVPPEQRQHPRRTSSGGASRTGCPPSLVRQCDRKVNFVDSLVGKMQCKSQNKSPPLNFPPQILPPKLSKLFGPFHQSPAGMRWEIRVSFLYERSFKRLFDDQEQATRPFKLLCTT